jgi:hypothetical protein
VSPLRFLGAAVLLVGSAAARAQLACSPAHLAGGGELRVTSPGAFGVSPSSDVTLTYRNTTAGGPAVRFPTTRAWSASAITFLFAVDALAPGAYEVVLSSPAGALRNPTCFTVDPPLRAITSIRGPAASSIPTATLDIVVDGDWPCDGETKITLWGTRFTPGTEAGGLDASAWRSGKTMVEIGYEGAASAGMPPTAIAIARLAIRDAGTMEFTVSRCLLMLPRLKVRVWFPDGTKSAWQYVRTAWDHPGSGVGVLTSH